MAPHPLPSHPIPHCLVLAEQQELFETPNGGLQEDSNLKCLCPDTRGSATPSPSATPAASPPPKPPAPSSLALGLGIPCAILGLAGLGLYLTSLATGTPIIALLTGGGQGEGKGGSLYRQSILGGAGSSEAAERASALRASEGTSLLR